MKIVDKLLLQSFRDKSKCEFCLRGGWQIEPHHVFTKGMGGARRFDIPINLIALCPECHHKFHNGRIEQWDILLIVADREGVTPQWIKEEIWRLRRDEVAGIQPSTETVSVVPVSPPALPVLRQVVKICKKCGKPKPLDQFPVVKCSRPYTRGACKDCTNQYQRNYDRKRKTCKKR